MDREFDIVVSELKEDIREIKDAVKEITNRLAELFGIEKSMDLLEYRIDEICKKVHILEEEIKKMGIVIHNKGWGYVRNAMLILAIISSILALLRSLKLL